MSERYRTVVLGCGPKGADWLRRQNGSIWYGGMDKKSCFPSPPNFVRGDGLYLPFKDESFDKIHSDFYINAIPMGTGAKDIRYLHVMEDPNLLSREPYPLIVRDWYNNEFKDSGDNIKNHLPRIGKMLRIAGIQEMWRTLRPYGEIVVVDFKENTDWFKEFAADILKVPRRHINFYDTVFFQDDFTRSESLTRLTRDGAKVAKTVFRKY